MGNRLILLIKVIWYFILSLSSFLLFSTLGLFTILISPFLVIIWITLDITLHNYYLEPAADLLIGNLDSLWDLCDI